MSFMMMFMKLKKKKKKNNSSNDASMIRIPMIPQQPARSIKSSRNKY
jgi:hypothetical protein